MKPWIHTVVFATALSTVAPSIASAQTLWVGHFHGNDDRLNQDYDWALGYWKGECGQDAPILVGASTHDDFGWFTEDWWTQDILCSSSSIQVSSGWNYVLTVVQGDDRWDTSTGDWAKGRHKAECGPTDVMVGLAQTTDDEGSNLVAARCMGTLNVASARDCAPVVSWARNARESPTFDGDWSYGYTKGQCGEGRYVKGAAGTNVWAMSIAGGTVNDVTTLLCCTPVFD
jgi:hypothetical protein